VWDQIITAIVSGVLSSGVIGTIVAYTLKRIDANRTAPTAEDMQDMRDKLDRDYQRFKNIDEKLETLTIRISDVDLTVLRQCLFSRPRDQNAFRSALDSGERYLAKGGNGTGHIRYDQLRREYEWRDSHDDWNPEHKPEQGGYHA
jgi:hypothetical protein